MELFQLVQQAAKPQFVVEKLLFLTLQSRDVCPYADITTIGSAPFGNQQPFAIVLSKLERPARMSVLFHTVRDPFFGAPHRIWNLTALNSLTDDCLKRHSRLDRGRCLVVQLLEAFVTENKAIIGIEQRKGFVDMLDRMAQASFGPAQRLLTFLQGTLLSL